MRKIAGLTLALMLMALFVGCNDDDVVSPSPVPAAPQGVFSVTGNHAVYIYWNGIYDNTVRQYVIHRSPHDANSFSEIGRINAVSNPDLHLLIYEYIDIDVVNGVTYDYALSSVNSYGRESDLSAEDVWDTPRPEGVVTLFPNNIAPELSGFNFETATPVHDTSPVADIFVDMTGDIYCLNVVGSGTDIMDMGYTEDFDSVSMSPSTNINVGWAELPWVELVVGHTYVIWTWDNHFAKVRAHQQNPSGSVTFEWAWQGDPGNPQLVPGMENLTRPEHNPESIAKLRASRAQESM